MADLADSLLVATRAAPRLDPHIAYGLATSPGDISDLGDLASSVEAYGGTAKFLNYLRQYDHTSQVSVWSSLNTHDRNLLIGGGYRPPITPRPQAKPQEHHHRGFFESVVRFAAAPITGGASLIAGGAAKGTSETLHDIGAPLRQVQHVYRAAALMTDEDRLAGGSGWGLSAWLKPFSPSEWSQTWRASEHGEQTFSPLVLRHLTQTVDPDTLELAKAMASGATKEAIANQAPADQRARIIQRLESDRELTDATRLLQQSKLSFGRRLAFTMHLEHNPALFDKVSGTADAVGDWYGDPIMIGAKAAHAANAARYVIRSGEDVYRVAQKPAVQRWLADVSSHLAEHAGGDKEALGRLAERHPQVTGLMDDLVKEGVTTPTELTDFLASKNGLYNIATGRLGGMVPHTQWSVMPRLTHTEQVGLAAKGALRSAIDFAADTPEQLRTRLDRMSGVAAIAKVPLAVTERSGRLLRGLTTLTANGLDFEPLAHESTTVIQRLASYFLPRERVRELVGLWAAATDLGARRGIYKGLLAETFDAAGLNRVEETRNWASRFLDGVDEGIARRRYAAEGIDKMVVNGEEVRAGLLEGHLSQRWGMPSYRDLTAQANRASFSRSVFGAVNSDFITAAMEKVWKPLTLLRLGFPVRAGGEELVRAIMQEGPLGLARGRLATGALRGEITAEDRLLPWHPLSGAWDHFTAHMPDEVKATLNTPSEFVSRVFADRARRAFRDVEARLAGERYMDTARRLYEGGYLEGAFAEQVSALHGRAAGYLDSPETAGRAARDGVNTRPVIMAPTGDYREYRAGDTNYVHAWRRDLHEASQSRLGRTALEHLGEGRDAQVTAVADAIGSEGFASQRARSVRSHYTRDGARVGIDATAEQANTDWANAVVDHVNSLVHSPDGTPIGDLAQRVRARDVPGVADLADVPITRQPEWVKGPDIMPDPGQGWFRRLIDKGFTEMVGRPMNWMIREPLFLHNATLAYDRTAEMLRPLVGEGNHVEQLLTDVAVERAVHATVPFIHNPQVRSMFAVSARNMAPFWFAQEQFYKRWASVVVHSPEAFRKAQLTMAGLRHVGFIRRDDQGNDYFMYPGVGAAQGVLVSALAHVGVKAAIPMPVGFAGEVRFATPGLERLGLPSFGPLVGVPVTALTHLFPEMADLQQGVLGERGAGRAYWEMVVPTTISRFVHAAIDQPDSSPQMASAMFQTIQYLEATGHGLRDDATPMEKEHWMDRVRDWTRILMFTRMIYGFGVPAAPELRLDPKDLDGELRRLMAEMPIDEAVSTFIERHPDANAYTVFQSKSASGASLPATAKTMRFMEANAEFLRSYPQASGWFVPQEPAAGFSFPAYREQLALGLRQRKGSEEFLRDVKFSGAADTYFTSRDRKEAALAAAADNPTRRAAIENAWRTWSERYMGMHPIFAEELQSPEGRIRRAETLTQARQAFADPRAPQGPQADAVRTMVTSFDRYEAARRALVGRNDFASTERRKTLLDAFNAWSAAYVERHPEAKGFYDRVVRLEVGG